MPVFGIRNLQQFRNEFHMPDKNVLRWFPGHMAGSSKKMQAKIKNVDCIIEVHDSRIPISGRNPNFKRDFLGLKPHILVLNKADLVDTNFNDLALNYLKNIEQINEIVYTNCKNQKKCEGIKTLVPIIQEQISKADRYNRVCNREFGVLIIGVPNVGKSSLINALRATYLKKPGKAPIGPNPGVTRSVQTRIKISNVPPVFIYDTPGILTPTLPSIETGMKLALCGTILDHLVGAEVMADFFLYWSNKNQVYNYLDFFGIKEPCDNISYLLTNYAIQKNLFVEVRTYEARVEKAIKPNLTQAAQIFINGFRSGGLGAFNLDVDLLR